MLALRLYGLTTALGGGMADVFISYAKKHAQLTEDLARDLEAEGFTTWWDTSLLPGDEFPEQIKHEIDAAQAVIVIWTESSVDSPWVRSEANRAHALDKLITLHAMGLNLDHVPLPFNTVQSSLVTDRAKVFAALAKRGVKPSGDVHPNEAKKIEKAPQRGPDKARKPNVDSAVHAAAAQEWAKIERTSDIGKLSIFARHFPGTYYADLAQKRIAELPAELEKAERLRLEEEAWKPIFAKKEARLAKLFLEQFPNGKHAAEAQEIIDKAQEIVERNNTEAFIALISFSISTLIFVFAFAYWWATGQTGPLGSSIGESIFLFIFYVFVCGAGLAFFIIKVREA
jgi:hypothetical protein